MNITWLGHSSFKIEGREVTLITDPFDDSIGFKFPKVSADIVTISHEHYDHANAGAVGGNPFIIDSPGEYEVKGVFIQGIPSFHDNKEGAERGQNIIYKIEIDDLIIAHLGDLGHLLTDKQTEKIEGIDILMLPVGGKFTIGYKEAIEIINQIEPRVVIPMHYHIPGLKIEIDPLDKFCKEMGCSPSDAVDKYKITKKDLPQEETKIIIFSKI